MDDATSETYPDIKSMTRRDFLRLGGTALGGAVFFNSLVGSLISKSLPYLPELPHGISEYEIGWNALPWVWVNLARASTYIDGKVIQPGEEISFIKLIELDKTSKYPDSNQDPQRGYVGAQLGDITRVQSAGYGLCLASTALFRAIVKSPLQVTEHHTHYTAYPDYFKDPKWPEGTDASVYYPEEGEQVPVTDLKFINPTDKPITLRFTLFDETGKEIPLPTEPMTNIQYKATLLSSASRAARYVVKKKTSISPPMQYIPDYCFGSRRIYIQAGVESKTHIPFSQRLGPIVASSVGGTPNYSYNRHVTFMRGSKTTYFDEEYSSQYGMTPSVIQVAHNP